MTKAASAAPKVTSTIFIAELYQWSESDGNPGTTLLAVFCESVRVMGVHLLRLWIIGRVAIGFRTSRMDSIWRMSANPHSKSELKKVPELMPNPERGTRSDAIREFLKTNPAAVTKDIITGLQEKGIEVSEALVHKIKYRSSKKRTKIRRNGAATGAGSQKVAVSKSEAIRAFLRQNPGATPKVVRAGLRKEGIKVTPGLVSNVAFYFRKKAAPRVTAAARRVRAKTTRPISAPATGVSFEQLVETKKLADSLGGTEQIRQALDMLAQLQ